MDRIVSVDRAQYFSALALAYNRRLRLLYSHLVALGVTIVSSVAFVATIFLRHGFPGIGVTVGFAVVIVASLIAKRYLNPLIALDEECIDTLTSASRFEADGSLLHDGLRLPNWVATWFERLVRAV